MSKVTSKLQVTIPKAIADRFGIAPGDEIDWIVTGESIRVVPGGRPADSIDLERRIAVFNAATSRQRRRDAAWTGPVNPKDRGWTREDANRRDRAR